MKVSEVIEELKNVLNDFGDIDIVDDDEIDITGIYVDKGYDDNHKCFISIN